MQWTFSRVDKIQGIWTIVSLCSAAKVIGGPTKCLPAYLLTPRPTAGCGRARGYLVSPEVCRGKSTGEPPCRTGRASEKRSVDVRAKTPCGRGHPRACTAIRSSPQRKKRGPQKPPSLDKIGRHRSGKSQFSFFCRNVETLSRALFLGWVFGNLGRGRESQSDAGASGADAFLPMRTKMGFGAAER